LRIRERFFAFLLSRPSLAGAGPR